jgi:tRNA(Ile)-lysidine synthase
MLKKKENSLSEQIKNTLSKIKEKKVVVACSGGPDSMVLLDILRIYKKDKTSSIIVAHINHCLRKTAIRDENIVKKYCQKH